MTRINPAGKTTHTTMYPIVPRLPINKKKFKKFPLSEYNIGTFSKNFSYFFKFFGDY